MKKIVIAIVSVAVVVGILLKGKALMETRKQEIADAPTPQTRSLSVSLTHATQEKMQESQSYLATLLSEKSIQISTKMAGYIEKIYVKESQHVTKGTLLATIDERDINTNIELLRTTLAQQKSDLALAQRIYQRNRKLYQVGGLAKEQLETSKVMMLGKSAAVKATEQKISQLQEQKSYLKIKAPFSGVIDTLVMHQGDLAVTGKPILRMSDGDQKLRFAFSKNSASIVEGQSVYLDQEPIGKVNKILTLAKQGLVQAEVKLDKKLSLPLGSTLTVRVVTQAKKGCVVPNDALLHKEDGLYVMRYKDKSFQAKKVQKVMERENKTMITPCIIDPIAQGSEVLLAKLPVFGSVDIRK